MAIARTATQDMQRQVKEKSFTEQNEAKLKGMGVDVVHGVGTANLQNPCSA